MQHQLHINGKEDIAVLKTVAVESCGVKEVIEAISTLQQGGKNNERKQILMTEKALRIIAKSKMKGFDKNALRRELNEAAASPSFNLYSFVKKYL